MIFENSRIDKKIYHNDITPENLPAAAGEPPRRSGGLNGGKRFFAGADKAGFGGFPEVFVPFRHCEGRKIPPLTHPTEYMPYSDVMGCFINYVAPAFTGATLHLFTRGLNARPPLILATFVARLWLKPKFIRIRTCALGGNRLAYMSEQNVCCHFFAGADRMFACV